MGAEQTVAHIRDNLVVRLGFIISIVIASERSRRASRIEQGLPIILNAICPNSALRLKEAQERMPIATNDGGAAILDGILYVVCGATSDGLTNKMWRLDTSTPKEDGRNVLLCPGRHGCRLPEVRGYQTIVLGGTRWHESLRPLACPPILVSPDCTLPR